MEPQTVKPESEAYSQGFSQHVDRQPNLPGVCSLLNANNRGTHFGGSMSIRKNYITVLLGLIAILLQSAQAPRQTPFHQELEAMDATRGAKPTAIPPKLCFPSTRNF